MIDDGRDHTGSRRILSSDRTLSFTSQGGLVWVADLPKLPPDAGGPPSRAGFENSIPPRLSFVVQEAAAAPDEVFGSVSTSDPEPSAQSIIGYRQLGEPDDARLSKTALPRPEATDSGLNRPTQPRPDHGETSYRGSGKLKGMKAVITGGDSGIGRAVAIAFAREGADVLIAFLNENEEATEVKKLIEKEGRKAVLVPGDLQDAKHCREVIKKAVDGLGGIDILVNNAAHQATFKDIGDISDEEWEKTFRTNIHSMFYLTKAAVPHMEPGSAIINTASVNSDMPNPMLLAYATTKGAIQNFTGGLAQMLAEKGIRANAVAPGPIWTPLIPSTMPDDSVKNFGKQVPMKRPGQPAELATAYVMLADPLSSYTSGTTIAVTGGKPFI